MKGFAQIDSKRRIKMTYSENLQLTLLESTDPVDYRDLNHNTGILDSLLGPVKTDFVASNIASRLAAYNIYQLMAASGTTISGKKGIFYGDFSSSTAATASTGALRSTSGYYFGPSVGNQLASSSDGDSYVTVGSGTQDNPGYTFSITCSGWATVTSISLDAYSSSDTSLYLTNFTVNGSSVSLGSGNTLSLGTPSTTGKSTLTRTFSSVLLSPGSVISGTIRTSSSSQTARLYGYNGTPYIRLGCRGCTPSGWVTSGSKSLHHDEFSRACAYVHLSTATNCTVSAAIIDSDGTEHEMTLVGTQDTVNPGGKSCVELCFQCPYTDSTANLKISVSVSGSGSVCLYSYGVTMM